MTRYLPEPFGELIYRDGSRLIITAYHPDTRSLAEDILTYPTMRPTDWEYLFHTIEKVLNQWHRLQLTHRQITPNSITVRNRVINLTQFEKACQPLDSTSSCGDKPTQLSRLPIKTHCGDGDLIPDPVKCFEAHQRIDHWQLANTIYNLWRLKQRLPPLTFLPPHELRVRINQVADWTDTLRRELIALLSFD